MKIIKNDDIICIYFTVDNYLSVIEISNINNCSHLYNLSGNVWYFNRLNVHKQTRNQGIATKMMYELIKILKEHKITLICEVNPYGDLNKQQLFDFYKSFGFNNFMDDILIFKP